MKTCKKCREAKPLDQFHKDQRKADGRRSRCKACTNAERYAFQMRHKAETGQWYSRQYKYERTCEVCGTTWLAKTKTARFCSTVCANTLRRYEMTCEGCGRQWITKSSKKARWCSPECRTLWREQIEREKQEAAWLPVVQDWRLGRVWCPIPDRHPARHSIPTPRLFVQGKCIRCGQAFCVHSEAGIAAYCSRRCQKSDAKAKRRALQKDAYVEHVYRVRVFERDKWTCKLCGKKTKRDAVVPHPRAPVLDHIIPLARGGKHEPANMQCAHFLCNSVKGDRGGGEQLLLIG